MCHPGYVADGENFPDSVKETRPIELEFLKSEAFTKIVNDQNFKISRFH
jgi:predicted glycoside hydrolase/deacetylase ChbG (UPF0249 family)